MLWARAVARIALRGSGTALLFCCAAGWVALAWLATDHRGHSMPFTVTWLAMIAAMAPLLLRREIEYLWHHSLRRSRCPAIASFVSGYVGGWLAAGLVLTMISRAVIGPGHLAIVIAVTALWHCSPARQRCLNRCHRVPSLRVFGMAAQRDALRYGISSAASCAGACGGPMLLVLIAGDHHLAGMAIAAALATIERHLPPHVPRWRIPFVTGRSAISTAYAVGENRPVVSVN